MAYRRLNLQDRQTIEQLQASGASQTSIAQALGVHRSTVSNELRRNSVGNAYKAIQAEELAACRAERRFNRPSGHKGKGMGSTGNLFRFKKRRKDPRMFRYRFYRKYFKKVGARFWFAQPLSASRFVYLKKRVRDHLLEGLARHKRSLADWHRYFRSPVQGDFTRILKRYRRTGDYSFKGIIKGLYRSRGWWSVCTEKSNHSQVWNHFRYIVPYLDKKPARKSVPQEVRQQRVASTEVHHVDGVLLHKKYLQQGFRYQLASFVETYFVAGLLRFEILLQQSTQNEAMPRQEQLCLNVPYMLKRMPYPVRTILFLAYRDLYFLKFTFSA